MHKILLFSIFSTLLYVSLGQCDPAISDFYDFEIGDVFQYERSYDSDSHDYELSIIRKEITDIVVTSDQITFSYDYWEFETYIHFEGWSFESEYTGSRTETVDLTSSNLLNKCEGLIIKNGLHETTLTIDNDTQTFHHYCDGCGTIWKEVYTKGLGQTEYYNNQRGSLRILLTAYIKGGDTTGTIDPSFIPVVNNVNNAEFPEISCFPNPTEGVVYFENIPDGAYIELTDALGRSKLVQSIEYQLDLSGMDTGQYYYKISSTNEVISIGRIDKQ